MHKPIEIIQTPENAKAAMMRAGAISEQQAHAILIGLAKSGWFLVPQEPTSRMVNSSLDAMRRYRRLPGKTIGERQRQKHVLRYRAMVEAERKVMQVVRDGEPLSAIDRLA